MLFKDLSIESIRKSIEDLREVGEVYEDSLKEKFKDFYEGRQTKDEYLANWGFKNKHGKLNLPPTSYNITKKIIDKISLVYKQPPMREGGGDYAVWVADNPEMHHALKVAERYKNLLGMVLFRPAYLMGKWRFFIETEYIPHFHEDDPLHPIGYSIPLKQDMTYAPDEEVWVFWSDDYYFFHDNNGRVWYDENYPDGMNPYGVMPFVELRSDHPVDQYASTGALSLIEANEAVNVSMMNLSHMIHFQAFDQMWAQGVDSDSASRVEVGPNKIIYLPDQASLNLLGFSPKITEAIEAVKFKIQAIGFTYNVAIDWSMEGSVASGVALKIRNMDLLEARQDDVDIARTQEQKIFAVLAAMQDLHRRTGEIKNEPVINGNQPLTVNFDDIEFPLSWQEEQAQWQWEFDHSISTPIDYMKSKDADLDDEQAMQQYQDNKATQGKLTRGDILRSQLTMAGGENNVSS